MLVDLSFYSVLHHHEDSGIVVEPPVEPDDIGMSAPSVSVSESFDDSDRP